MADGEDLGGGNGVKSDPLQDISSNSTKLNGSPTKDSVPPKTQPPPEDAQKLTMTEPADQEAYQDPKMGVLANDSHADTADLEDEGEAAGIEMGMGMGAGKKKKKRKPKSKRGLNAPTGFEEYYVDAPLTPAEYDEEKQIYDQSYRFTQRIETAVQRFTAKRRLESETKTLFDRYLVHGGIEGGPKMFSGGLDAQTLKTKNAAEIADLAAIHYVDSDKVDAFDSTHVVDFEGCLKSFLSGQLPTQWDLVSEEQIKKLVGVIRNFLNYLLHHDVCPEHKDQIDSARVLCDKATKELWNIASMTPVLPGDFNMACSEIFGGMYQGLYSTDQTWMGESDTLHSLGIGPERARQAFKIGIAANSSDEMFQIYRQQLSTKSCRLASTEETAFEITEIGHPTETVLGLYAQQQSAGLKTLGKMKAKTWSSANAPEEDITEAEEAFLKANPPKFKNYEFWVEEEILKNCEVGMKFEATVRETSFGLSYFDAIGGVYCSFYQLIPNNLMEDWREIEKEWLPPKYNKNKAAKREAEAQEVSAGGDEGQGNIEDHTEPLADEQGIEAITEEGKEGTEAEDTYVNANMVAAGYDEEVGKKKPETEEEPGDIDADSEETVERGFGVEVQKVGVEVKKVTGNARTVTQENFDVKRIDEAE